MTSLADNHLSWEQTGPGRWERDIDEVEQFYTALSKAYEGTGKVYFAVTGFTHFSVPVPPGLTVDETEKKVEDALRFAWTRLRVDHPTIASRVSYNPTEQKYKKTYETSADGTFQQKWLEDTFRVIPERMTGLDWCNLNPPAPALATLFLIRHQITDNNGSHADLVLRAHHDIIDGMGALLLLNNLFLHAAEAYEHPGDTSLPQFGNEWSNLSPPLRLAAGISAVISPTLEERFRGILKYNASLKEGAEIASLPFERHIVMPGNHQRTAVTLSEDTTANLLRKCRALNLTITHAYHAAIALTVGDLVQRKERERVVRYISYCLINERHHCKSPYNTPSHAVSVYHSVSGQCLGIDLTIPAVTSSNVPKSHQDKFFAIAMGASPWTIPGSLQMSWDRAWEFLWIPGKGN